ncbi:MAG: isochorismate synthase [Acidimicrobiia bacterium]|nr:isochorismate synthase [Acidimicrobiia bacterium]
MFFPADEIAAMRSAAALADVVEIATTVDPVALARAAAPLFSVAQLICSPDGSVRLGLGSAWRRTASGDNRFAALEHALEDVPGNQAFAGFSFRPEGPNSSEWDSFPSAELTVPQVAVVNTTEGSRLTIRAGSTGSVSDLIDLLAEVNPPSAAAEFEPGDHSVVSRPSSSEWRSEVEEAIGAIGQGSLAKVVLSRAVDVITEHTPHPFDMVDYLRTAYPQCYVFVWQAGPAAFFGASPELLLESTGESVLVNPLAGSARRGEGDEDDRAVGEALMHSAKDREEHALVVQDIAERLEPYVERVNLPNVPSLRRMATVQHLSSEIHGELVPDVGPFQLVEALHPTPAVGGTPRAEALAFVDKAEGIDRGWYAGGIGYVSGGRAAFAIPLRCALVVGNVSRLYAGAGIVADSNPDDELNETRLKFRPMLNLLTAT